MSFLGHRPEEKLDDGVKNKEVCDRSKAYAGVAAFCWPASLVLKEEKPGLEVFQVEFYFSCSLIILMIHVYNFLFHCSSFCLPLLFPPSLLPLLLLFLPPSQTSLPHGPTSLSLSLSLSLLSLSLSVSLSLSLSLCVSLSLSVSLSLFLAVFLYLIYFLSGCKYGGICHGRNSKSFQN